MALQANQTRTQVQIISSNPIEVFCADNNIRSISKVRVNKNGFPFCTFLNSANEAENIYFSRNLASDLGLSAGDAQSCLKGRNILKLEILDENENGTGEFRLKIAKSAGEDYMSVADLF